MKALFQGHEYVIIEDDGNEVTLEPVEGTEDTRITVPFSDPTLIIEPTDGDLAEAKAWREKVPLRAKRPKQEHYNANMLALVLNEKGIGDYVPVNDIIRERNELRKKLEPLNQRQTLERMLVELKAMPAHDIEIGIAINAISKALRYMQPPYTTVERINE